MRWMTNLKWRLRAIFKRGSMDRELNEEMAFHLEMEVKKNVARGMDAAEARRAAWTQRKPGARHT